MPRSIQFPPELQKVIDLHQEMFGGLVMMADSEEQPKPDASKAEGDKTPEQKPDGAKPADELGENGIKALHAERDARKAIEQQLADLKQGLAGIAGVATDKGSKPEDAIAALNAKIEALETSNQIAALARTHGITSEDDIKLLALTSPDARSALAERLKPAAGGQQTPGKPKPDPSIGRGAGTEGKSGGSVAAGRDLYAERHKKSTN